MGKEVPVQLNVNWRLYVSHSAASGSDGANRVHHDDHGDRRGLSDRAHDCERGIGDLRWCSHRCGGECLHSGQEGADSRRRCLCHCT